MNLADVNGIAPNAFDFSYDPLSIVPDVMLREVCLAAIWTGSDMPHNAAANIRHASGKGKIVGGGIAVNPQHNASWHFNAARALPNDAWEMLDFVWLDLEGPAANGISTAEIDQILDLMGHRIIYTSRGWWESQNQLKGYDPKAWLWDARWPAEGSTHSPAFVPYGPWKSESQLVAVQTCGGYQIVPGMAVDDDVFDWRRIMDAPTKAEFQALAAYTVAQHDAITEIGKAFFDHVQHSGGDTSAVQAQIDAIDKKLADAAIARA